MPLPSSVSAWSRPGGNGGFSRDRASGVASRQSVDQVEKGFQHLRRQHRASQGTEFRDIARVIHGSGTVRVGIGDGFAADDPTIVQVDLEPTAKGWPIRQRLAVERLPGGSMTECTRRHKAMVAGRWARA